MPGFRYYKQCSTTYPLQSPLHTFSRTSPNYIFRKLLWQEFAFHFDKSPQLHSKGGTSFNSHKLSMKDPVFSLLPILHMLPNFFIFVALIHGKKVPF